MQELMASPPCYRDCIRKEKKASHVPPNLFTSGAERSETKLVQSGLTQLSDRNKPEDDGEGVRLGSVTINETTSASSTLPSGTARGEDLRGARRTTAESLVAITSPISWPVDCECS